MTMIPRFPILCTTLLLILTSCTEEAEPTLLDRSDNGQSISTAVGQVVTIHLEGNPSTGYQWLATENDALDISISFQPAPQPPETVGASGLFEIKVTPLNAGDTQLQLEYRREWLDQPPTETFVLQLDVTE